jgi:hypothetical protein
MDTVKIKSMSITEIKEILFSKDTISALNKQVLENGVYCSSPNDQVSKCVLISDLMELNPK